MFSPRQLELVETLFELEPDTTYAQRAVAATAELAAAAGYRLTLETTELRHKAPAAGDGLTIPLTHGKQSVGKLHLYAADGSARLSDDSQRLARWAARLLARGLVYASRVGAPKNEIDVKALLESTPLTPRERDVVGRLVSGASTREISDATGLTISTVNTYMKRIFAKLGVHSRVELLARVTGTHASRQSTAVA
ncbi:MAG: helix-turn-helix transcriptional regulator [Sandaracinaceae bacterium]|nr:helix-turn-helix transcriptional regulator [Sandaracinaceae bacterium]